MTYCMHCGSRLIALEHGGARNPSFYGCEKCDTVFMQANGSPIAVSGEYFQQTTQSFQYYLARNNKSPK